MPDGYLSFSMKSTDMAYAITQQQLNNALGEFLLGENAPISFAYDLDDDGNPIQPADPSNPQVSFNATIGLPKDGSGALLPIVDMSNPGASNGVSFSLGFEGGTFVDETLGVSYKQSDPEFQGQSWTVTFDVLFKQVEQVDPELAPESAAKVLSSLNSQFDDAFSLSQILIDLSSVSAPNTTSRSAPQGFKRGAWIDFVACLSTTLQSKAGTIFTSPLAAGYAVYQSSANEKTPTFTPTDIEITILGNASNPAASLLIFGMATKGSLPDQWQEDFSGTNLVIDPSTTPGLAFVRSDLFTGFLQTQLASSSYPSGVGSYIAVGTNSSFSVFYYGEQLTTPPPFTPQTPTSGNPVLGSVEMNGGSPFAAQPFNTSSGSTSLQYTASTTSTSSVSYYCQAGSDWFPTLEISGTFSLLAQGLEMNRLISTWQSPTFTYNWQVKIDFEVSNDTGLGSQGIGFGAPSSSAIQSEDDSTEQGWFEAAPAIQQQLSQALIALYAITSSSISDIAWALSGLSLFVFPGAGNFTFQNPGVNGVFTLVATIQYENPG